MDRRRRGRTWQRPLAASRRSARSTRDRSPRSQAEDGNPELFEKKFLTVLGGLYIGVFNKPVGADKPAPIFSGGAFEFEFTATEGMKLDMTTMYGQSNDLFYGPKQAIDLFDAEGKGISGDLTDKFLLWDAGTEINQAPGLGADQAPRQKAPNTGANEYLKKSKVLFCASATPIKNLNGLIVSCVIILFTTVVNNSYFLFTTGKYRISCLHKISKHLQRSAVCRLRTEL